MGIDLSIEDAVDHHFLAQEDDSMKECPGKCKRAYGWEAHRLCNLPETLLIYVDRVQQRVRFHASSSQVQRELVHQRHVNANKEYDSLFALGWRCPD